MRLGPFPIAHERRPVVVAEISGNHLGRLESALELIRAAADTGAQAVKFQCYEPEDLVIGEHMAPDPWGGSLADLYKKAHTPKAWMPRLFEEASKRNILAFTSIFNEIDIPMLEGLGCPAYKIASAEIADPRLIKAVAATGKPMILSTGMAYPGEAIQRVHQIRHVSPETEVAILHCVSDYPTRLEDADFLHFPSREWADAIGFSDHTTGTEAACMAVALGARIIEKHLWLGGRETPDSTFSLDPKAFTSFVDKIRAAWLAMTCLTLMKPHPMRRSCHARRRIEKGETLDWSNVVLRRPNTGLDPERFERTLLGKPAGKAYERGASIHK